MASSQEVLSFQKCSPDQSDQTPTKRNETVGSGADSSGGRLKKAAELTLDKQIVKEALEGNF